MSWSKYKKIRIIILTLILLGVAISAYFELLVISFLSVGSGMVALTFFRAQVKEIVEDERVKSIHEKAARSAFKILMPILGLTALALMFAGNGPFYFLRSLGIILGYVTLVGLMVYLISYVYFNKEYGG